MSMSSGMLFYSKTKKQLDLDKLTIKEQNEMENSK